MKLQDHVLQRMDIFTNDNADGVEVYLHLFTDETPEEFRQPGMLPENRSISLMLKKTQFDEFAKSLKSICRFAQRNSYSHNRKRNYLDLTGRRSILEFFKAFIWSARVTNQWSETFRALDRSRWLRMMLQKFVDNPFDSLPGVEKLSPPEFELLLSRLTEFWALVARQ